MRGPGVEKEKVDERDNLGDCVRNLFELSEETNVNENENEVIDIRELGANEGEWLVETTNAEPNLKTKIHALSKENIIELGRKKLETMNLRKMRKNMRMMNDRFMKFQESAYDELLSMEQNFDRKLAICLANRNNIDNGRTRDKCRLLRRN